MYDGMRVYKGIIVNSSATTGLVYVKIPAILGPSESVAVSKTTLTNTGGVWAVPAEGAQVLVAVEDMMMSNVYLLTSSQSSGTSQTAVGGEEFSFFLGDL